ncbi:MAG: Ni/Fe-hydrogenase, b-type cytochrome subunit, partial [Zetaproteobacteria bacterium]|nr:Ni/Fe-hydrogenase, b-type cytochrome subunit [Flavobacteriales bacterium]
MKTKNFKRVYVWEVPVRIFHWINVLSLTVLVLSGFLIANPPALLSNAEPFNLHMFGTVRFLHFSAAYIFFFNMILRIYWSFVGNQFSNWRAFWPFTKKNWSNFKHVLKIDILLKNDKIPQD